MKVRYFFIPAALFLFFIPFLLSGCGPAVVGGTAGAAYGGYKGATDKRTIGTMVDDSMLSTTVKTKMISDPYVKAHNIDVDVLNGVVYLIGVVESDTQRKVAGDIARGVKGVRSVENQLVVGSISAGQALNDTILTSRIKAELIKDPDIRSTNVDVDTSDDTITLTGILRSQYEKNRVLAIVHNVGGQRKVVDNLQVAN